MELSAQGREYIHWPFWGAGLTAMQIDVGSGWVDMELVADYVPAVPVDPGAVWFRALIAGPQVSGNPPGTAVLAASNQVRFRLTSVPEIVIRTDSLLRLGP